MFDAGVRCLCCILLEHVASGEGWKSIMNWRKLTTDTGYSAVQKILGEPHQVDGGQIALSLTIEGHPLSLGNRA